MARIIGHQKFHSKAKDKDYIRVYFTWSDDAVKGEACDTTVVGVEYFDKLVKGSDDLRVGYDKEQKSRFLYVGR